MTRRRNLPLQIAELSLAAPQVVAHRLTRMALAGPNPSARDRREMHLMGAEKAAAFWESWAAMGWQAVAAQQRALLAMQTAAWTSLPMVPLGASMELLSHGLAPVHRRAVANAKRLAAPRRSKR